MTQELDHSAWGKLVSKNTGAGDYLIKEDEVTIGRKATNNIVINDQNLSGNHCVITKRGDKIYLKDLSTNGTYINNNKVGQGKEVELQHKAEIWLLHVSRVPADKTIGYVLELTS